MMMMMMVVPSITKPLQVFPLLLLMLEIGGSATDAAAAASKANEATNEILQLGVGPSSDYQRASSASSSSGSSGGRRHSMATMTSFPARQITAAAVSKRSPFDQIDDRSDMAEVKRSFDEIDDATDLEEGKRGEKRSSSSSSSSSKPPHGGFRPSPLVSSVLQQLVDDPAAAALPVFDNDDVIGRTTSKMADLNDELRRLASIVCGDRDPSPPTTATTGQRVTSLNRKRSSFAYGPKVAEFVRKRSFDPIGEASDLSEVK